MATRARGMRGARKMGGFTKIHVVSSEDAWADTLAKAKDKLLIVEFSAAWSAPCKAMDPYFVALSKQAEYKGIKFCRVDIDKCSKIALSEGVLAAPTFAAYRSGKKLDSFSGALPQKLVELIETHKGKKKSTAGLSLLMFLAAIAAGGAYMFKVVIPKTQKEAEEAKKKEEAERLAAEAFRPKHPLPAAVASTSGAGAEGSGEAGVAGAAPGAGEDAPPRAAAAELVEEELVPAAAGPSSPGKKKSVGPSRGARKQQ